MRGMGYVQPNNNLGIRLRLVYRNDAIGGLPAENMVQGARPDASCFLADLVMRHGK